MGVDLRLLPVDAFHDQDPSAPWGFSHTVLSCPQRSDAWSDVSALNPERIPANADISSFVGGRVPDGEAEGEYTYSTLTEDAYGDPYTWVSAGQLKPVLAKWFPGHPVTAYINAMEDGRRVILDWH